MATTTHYSIELDPNQYDPAQIELMEERLILLDNDDRATGEGSKKDCGHSSARYPVCAPR